ncbi:hypothetical protein Ancab_019789 [Ancistrocladus abbreviatus]
MPTVVTDVNKAPVLLVEAAVVVETVPPRTTVMSPIHNGLAWLAKATMAEDHFKYHGTTTTALQGRASDSMNWVPSVRDPSIKAEFTLIIISYLFYGASKDYCDESDTQWPCVPGQGYYGRRPIQITWNYNYGPAGQSIGFDGLNSAGTVATDPVISFKTAFWFWMNNVHQGFEATIRAINGRDCNGGNSAAVNARVSYYTDYCNQFGVSPGDNLYC